MKKLFLIAFLVVISPLSAAQKSRAELIANYERFNEGIQKSKKEDNEELIRAIGDVKTGLQSIKTNLSALETNLDSLKTTTKSIKEDLNSLEFDGVRFSLLTGLALHIPSAGLLDIAVIGVTGFNPHFLEISGALFVGSLLAQPILEHEKNDIKIKYSIQQGLMSPQEIKDYYLIQQEQRRVFDEARF